MFGRLHKPIMRRPYDPRQDASLAAWYRPGVGVTGTLTASAWADQSGNGRDLAQATGGNQPIYLPYSGTPYAWFPSATAGNCVRTPQGSGVIGDIEVVVLAAFNNLSTTANEILWSEFDGVGTGIHLGVFPTNNSLYIHNNSLNTQSTVTLASLGLSNGVFYYWKFTRVAATGACTFSYSLDGSIYTTIGATTGAFNGAVVSDDTASGVGNHAVISSTSTTFDGKIASVIVKNGIAGTIVQSFYAADFAETCTNGATAVSSTTGETWTLNSTGAKPASIIKSACLLGDGTTSKMATANFTLDQPFTDYFVARPISWTAGDVMSSGTAGVAGITQVTGTPKINLNAGSAAAENTNAALGSKCVITAVFNGASSVLQVNATTATTGDPGAGDPGGLSLFSDNAGANYWNGMIYERVTFSAAHTAAQRAVVQRYLASEHQLAL